MTDATLTFTDFDEQSDVILLDDPSKPGWEDYLAVAGQGDQSNEDEEDQENEFSYTF